MSRLSVPFRSVLVVPLLFATAPTLNPAAAASQVAAPGQRVSGQPAARTIQETDRLEFRPALVGVNAGDVVEWDNRGAVAHNVTFDQYPTMTSETMQGGDTFEVKFTVPGTYQYRCTFHPGMNGSVTVSPRTDMKRGNGDENQTILDR